MAASNVHHPAAIRFLFRILDVDKVGYLSEHAVREYVNEVLNAAKMVGGGGGFEVKDIVNEVFDMARADQTKRIITLNDLLKCGVGGTIIRILVDVHGLSQYDQFLSSGG
ncbi:hypothetical protein BCR44DRAFT_125778 [Catenaria anguillulae PL171]|uniref:EF-hand domain-containing protein n=1 Tax=Catenaria anguillulae PL171 TaxID=765915 RepID=A0A1Y2HKQ0_9FUNG|nr:hypothetical protein BCR44DRAFT_125778 [Catenaria anguillulae PL171]